MRDTDPGIVRMLWRLAGEQSEAAYKAVVSRDPAAAEITAQAARTYQAAKDPGWRILFWTDLCPPCLESFEAWRDAPNPDDHSHMLPHAVAFAHPSGYDQQVTDRSWRETTSYQQLLVRALCTAGRHGGD